MPHSNGVICNSFSLNTVFILQFVNMYRLPNNVLSFAPIGIVYQLKRVRLEDGKQVFCLYVSRDPDDPYSKAMSFNNFTLASSFDGSFSKSQNVSQSISLQSQSISQGTSSLEDSALDKSEVCRYNSSPSFLSLLK